MSGKGLEARKEDWSMGRIRRLKASNDPWDAPINERELSKLVLDHLNWIPNSSFKKVRGSMGMKGILDIIGYW